MKKIILTLAAGIFANLLLVSSAFAFSSGSLTCSFDIYAFKNWPNAEKTPEFKIDIMSVYESSIESKWLDHKISLRYVPGLVAANDVQIASVDMTYNEANAGADVSLTPQGIYIFKIGRQDSDLFGAFLNCKADDLK